MKRVILALVALLALVACTGGGASTTNTSEGSTVQTKTTDVGCVEVLYLHGKQRCVTCVAIGTEAEAVVKELNNNKVVMRDVDFSTAEGEKIADAYEIASSSIIVVGGEKVVNLTAVGFQYARNNPELFRENLREAIQNLLE